MPNGLQCLDCGRPAKGYCSKCKRFFCAADGCGLKSIKHPDVDAYVVDGPAIPSKKALEELVARGAPVHWAEAPKEMIRKLQVEAAFQGILPLKEEPN